MKAKSLKYLFLMFMITFVINEAYSYAGIDLSIDEIHLEIESENELDEEIEMEEAIEDLSFNAYVVFEMDIPKSKCNRKKLYLLINDPPPQS